jgi:mannan endo-1,4-beta-mannosidase
MDIYNNGQANGTKIIQYSDNGSDAQRFKLMPQFLPATSANIPNGTYSIEHKSSKKVISTQLKKENSVPVYLWAWENHDDQKFIFERLSDGTYKIQSVYSGKVLDVANITISNNAAIHQYDWTGTNNQRWYIIDCGNGYYKFVAKNSGGCIDIKNNASINGTAVIQFEDNGNDSQRFRLVCQSSHTYGAWAITKAATETTTGIREHTCTICGAKETENIPKLTHIHNYGFWLVTTPATETTAGVETRTCMNNSAHKETRSIPKLTHTHTFGAWKASKSATCTATGTETRTCTKDSGHKETRKVAALGHKWSA